MTNKVQWGIVGMGVMGTSLSRNFAGKGIQLALFNRRLEGIEEDVALTKKHHYPELHQAQAYEDLVQFTAALESPRKILLMLPAGKPTSLILDQLTPLLSEGDIVIDGGNTHYQETENRASKLSKKGILFLGIGVSGGEAGALKGPSLMAGGDQKAYEIVKKDLFQIAAKNSKGNPCCAYFGSGGAGHYAKMVHNGIEYAEMQLLAEVYALSHHSKIQPTLEEWNSTASKSYLLEITAALLAYQEDNMPFIEKIEDQASNKGTGAWATAAGTTLGYPNNLMSSALHARYISSFKEDRIQFAKQFNSELSKTKISFSELKKSYDLSRWINHHQGFEMLDLAAKEYNWKLNLSEVASVWAEGCIIKSELMDFCITLFKKEKSILLSEDFKKLLEEGKDAWKNTILQTVENEIPVLSMQAAWSYFVAMKTKKSTANIIQAQRDYFGAHGFNRTDQENSELLHGPWNKDKL